MGFGLPAKYIIHTVGPIWSGGRQNEPALLRQCYESCMKIALAGQLASIAFPNISTGVYGFPKQLAFDIAFDTIQEQLATHKTIKKLLFVCFDEENYQLYQQKIKQ